MKNTKEKNKFTKLKWLVPLIAVLLISGYFVAKKFAKSDEKVSYETSTVETGTLITNITGSGKVSVANVEVMIEATGVVTKVLVSEGSQVKTGQPLAILELDLSGKQRYSSALTSYLSAKNNLESAKASLYSAQSKAFAVNEKFINDAVARELQQDDPTYIQQNADWLAAEIGYKNAEKAIGIAQQSLNSSWISLQQSSPTIYSPVSGKVIGLSIAKDMVITSDTKKVGSISTSDLPVIEVGLTETDILEVSNGDKAMVTLDVLGDGVTFTGKVISIDRAGVTTSGVTTYPVLVQLSTANDQILNNMSASVSIVTDTKLDVLKVPSSAIVVQNGENFVRTLNGEIRLVSVEIGASNETETEIISGVKEGDVVITSIVTTSTTTKAQSTSPFSVFGGSRSGTGANIRMMSR